MLLDSIVSKDTELLQNYRDAIIVRDTTIAKYQEKDLINGLMIDNLNSQIDVYRQQSSQLEKMNRRLKWITIGSLAITTVMILK